MWTLDKLTKHFPGHTQEQLQKVLGIIKGTINPESLPGVAKWVGQCYHRPGRTELTMAALNEALEYFGVEALGLDTETNNFRTGTVSTYCNSGDTYGPTIVHLAERGIYKLTDVGSILEAQEHA